MLTEPGLGSLMGNGVYPARYCVWEEDFINFDTTDTLPINFTASGGNAAVPTISSILDEAFGVLQLSTAPTPSDNSYVSYLTAGEFYIPVTGKRMVYKTRFNIGGDVTQSDFAGGVMDGAATDVIGGIVDGLYFRKHDGEATCDFVICGASTEVELETITTLVLATHTELAFEWLSTGAGSGILKLFQDGKPIRGYERYVVASGAPNALMGLGGAIQAGDATTTDLLNLDYIGISFER